MNENWHNLQPSLWERCFKCQAVMNTVSAIEGDKNNGLSPSMNLNNAWRDAHCGKVRIQNDGKQLLKLIWDATERIGIVGYDTKYPWRTNKTIIQDITTTNRLHRGTTGITMGSRSRRRDTVTRMIDYRLAECTTTIVDILLQASSNWDHRLLEVRYRSFHCVTNGLRKGV